MKAQLAIGTISVYDLCWHEGMPKWLPIGAVLNSEPFYFYISVPTLILLSILSFGFYEGYWMYRNWRYLQERDNLPIRPFWRVFFAFFFCHDLFRRIHEDPLGRTVQAPSFPAGTLATAWVVLTIITQLISRIPGNTATVLSAIIPSFLCLVPVQQYINSVNERVEPGRPYYHWQKSAGHWICLGVGALLWVATLFSILLGDEALIQMLD